MSNSMEREQRQDKRLGSPVLGGLPMNPRWRCPALNHGFKMPLCRWARRPGASADDAYDCIMVRSTHGSTEYKVVA